MQCRSAGLRVVATCWAGIMVLASNAQAQSTPSSDFDQNEYVNKQTLTTRKILVQTNDGLSLPATLSLPVTTKSERIPAVLIIQGSGPTDRDGNQPPALITDLHKKVAFALAGGGIASLRFDKRGLNGTFPAQPDQMASFSRWEYFVDDALSAYRKLADRPEIDSQRIGIFGHSEGGMLALEIATRLQRDGRPPAALVLAATPGRTMDVVLRGQLEDLAKRQGGSAAAQANALGEVDRAIAAIKNSGRVPADLPPNIAPIFPGYLGPFFQSWFAVNMIELAQQYSGPVLLVTGSDDKQVSPDSDTGPLAAAFNRRPRNDLKVMIIANASHNLKHVKDLHDPGIAGPLAPTVAKTLSAWFSLKLFQ